MVISRGTAVKKSDGLYFQALDGRYITELADLFEQVMLLCPMVEESDKNYRTYSGYQYSLDFDRLEVIKLPSIGWRQWALLWKSIKQGDLALSFMPNFQAVAGTCIAALLRKPRIVYLGSDWRLACLTASSRLTWRRRARAWAYGLLERITMRLASLRIVAGRELLEKYQSLPPTYQTVTMRQIGKDDLFQRDDTCEKSPLRLICVASLTPRKGLPYLLQACKTLQEEEINFYLRLVGAGEEQHLSSLKQLSVQYNLSDKVHFEGYVGDSVRLLELYRDSDIFILPSLHEGYPRVVDEAMSQSLPVVCTAVGGIPTTLVNEVQALIVPQEDADGLASAIMRIKDDSGLRRSLIKAGYTRAIEEFDREVSPAAQLADLARSHGLTGPKLGSSSPELDPPHS